MAKKFVTFKTTGNQQVVINKDLVTHLAPSPGWNNLNGFPRGAWAYAGTDVSEFETETTVQKNKTAIWLSGNTSPVVVDMQIINVIQLLDLEGDYSLEESIYGE